jgi:hypothetical protein
MASAVNKASRVVDGSKAIGIVISKKVPRFYRTKRRQ